jgi:hypothetical protein
MAISRRTLLASAPVALAAVGLTGCAPGAEAYEVAVTQTWRVGPPEARVGEDLSRELVRLATLAPSSHNTQCWRFRLGTDRITILPDFTRRCPAVDPDDHHLFVSLGCAVENLVIGALAHDLAATVEVDETTGAVHIALAPTKGRIGPEYSAIARRQSTRGDYDGRPLAVEELAALEAATGSDAVRVLLLTDRGAMDAVLEFVVEGNSAQIADPAFVAELREWIRFNGAEAVRTGDGLYGASSGNPTLPTWLGRSLFPLVFRAGPENDKYASQMRSSAGVAVFVAAREDRRHWVEVGRAYQRFALAATAIDVRTAFLNQPVEVASIRPRFAAHLGLGGARPDLVIRFGRGPTLPPSLRRPVESVLL